MKQKKKWLIIGIVVISLLLISVGFVLSSSEKKEKTETDPRMGLWKMVHMKLNNGYEVNYNDQEYSDAYYYFEKDNVTIFRLSSSTVILKQDRFYQIQNGELLLSKTKDFKNPREYEFTSGIQKRMIDFKDDKIEIVETTEDHISTETYQKVDETLVKQLKENYDRYVNELKSKVPEGN